MTRIGKNLTLTVGRMYQVRRQTLSAGFKDSVTGALALADCSITWFGDMLLVHPARDGGRAYVMRYHDSIIVDATTYAPYWCVTATVDYMTGIQLRLAMRAQMQTQHDARPMFPALDVLVNLPY